MKTEDDEDSTRAPFGAIRGEVRFEDVTLRVQPRRAGAEARLVHRAGGHHDRARRIERLGQEHADQPRHGVQPAAVRADFHRRTRPRHRPAARLPHPARRRPPGQLPVRRDRRRQHPYGRKDATAEEIRRGRPHRPRGRVHRRVREEVRHDRGGARRQAVGRAAAAGRDRARDPGGPAHPRAGRSDVEPRQRERGADPGWAAFAARRAARRSSSRTGSRRSGAPTRSSSSNTARSWSAARTTS